MIYQDKRNKFERVSRRVSKLSLARFLSRVESRRSSPLSTILLLALRFLSLSFSLSLVLCTICIFFLLFFYPLHIYFSYCGSFSLGQTKFNSHWLGRAHRNSTKVHSLACPPSWWRLLSLRIPLEILPSFIESVRLRSSCDALLYYILYPLYYIYIYIYMYVRVCIYI